MVDDYIQKVPYPLSKSEEKTHINNINNLLKTFENLLTIDSNEMNDVKIIQSSTICELMLSLLLKRKNFIVKKNTPFTYLINFSKRNNIIPNQCCNFLEIIKNYRNKTVHDLNTSRYLTSTFLKAFMNYITWFNLNYPSPNQFKIDKCCAIIYSKYAFANDNTRLYNIYGNIYDHIEEKINTFECPKCKFTLYKGNNFCTNCGTKIENNFESKITSKINKIKNKYINNEKNQTEEDITHNYEPNFNQEEILKDLNKQNNEIKKIIEKLTETVEGIDEKLDNILNQLDHVHSHTEKLIKTAITEEEIDRIIHVHTTQCVENILEYQNNIVKDENYDKEKINLIKIFGEESWKKLSEKSKTFLITSKFMYNHLSKLNENFDYSGICVLTTKALEVEIFNRFYTDFLKYLDAKYHEDYSKYHTALLYKNSKKLLPERFTMGKIAYIFCYYDGKFDTENEKVNNKIILMEYCKNSLFSNCNEEEITSTLNEYGQKIEFIKDKYRNPSAHRDEIERIDAKECIDLIIDVEKLLKQMIDSFDY